ncbi:MAG: hypothetical protein CVU84_01760 [Firmicutes bacterium HGW-Firmicutes-1]|jgi:glyoxylase-like metal-dependent hydrolase (beta-lactamase superfamily II)|nr:MAG: hypothetical protein CVU84_01760 [Firmicutes bacterium HGW-Firmicutes-1]
MVSSVVKENTMEIKTIVTGVLQTNTYLVINEGGKDAVLIDPAADSGIILEEIAESDVNLKAILITHGHFDHIGEVDFIRQHFNVPVYAHKDEANMMKNEKENLSLIFFGRSIVAHADSYIDDGDILDFGEGLEFKCIVVPGHTSNSVCFYNDSYDFLVTGDTLMAGAIGRTDLNNTSAKMLANNIEEKLLVLPDHTVVYPGHGYKTKIIVEKESNPFL